MVTVQQIEKGFARWLDNELMPQMPQSGWKKVLAGAAASLMIKRGGSMVTALMEHQVVKALDIARDGEIDLETIRDEVKANMTAEGLRIDIPLIGALTMHKSDIDTLCAYIMEA